jgi:hypothetical protein|tara:strand:- start:353 stop:706 length:354 start_codon:yes stop_codon:yes gene_type:complete
MANNVRTYNGRVSSKKTGVFYSPNQSLNGWSTLPTEETSKLQPLFYGTTTPSSFLEKYPRVRVSLQDDGSIKSIERDVIALDAEGNEIPLADTSSDDFFEDSETETTQDADSSESPI